MCELGFCYNSAPRQRKTYTDGALVVRHGIKCHTQVRGWYRIPDAKKNIGFEIFTLCHSYILLTVVSTPRNEICRSHGSSQLSSTPPSIEVIAAFYHSMPLNLPALRICCIQVASLYVGLWSPYGRHLIQQGRAGTALRPAFCSPI